MSGLEKISLMVGSRYKINPNCAHGTFVTHYLSNTTELRDLALNPLLFNLIPPTSVLSCKASPSDLIDI